MLGFCVRIRFPGRVGRRRPVDSRPGLRGAAKTVTLADGRRFRVRLVWPDDYKVTELKGEE